MDTPIDETFKLYNNPSFLETARRIAINTSLSTEEAMRALGQAMDRGLKWSDLSVSGLPPFTKEQAMGSLGVGGFFKRNPDYTLSRLANAVIPKKTPDAAEVTQETYQRIADQIGQRLAQASWDEKFFNNTVEGPVEPEWGTFLPMDEPTAAPDVAPPPVAPPPPLPPRYKRLIRE